MSEYYLLFFYLFVAIFTSFLCSVLEAVLLTIPPSYVAVLSDKSPSLGAKIKKLKTNVDKPLSAILSLNTIAHTIGAAGVGAQAAVIWGNESLGVVSAVMTLLILILSEIIPKTLGANYWKKLIGFTANTLNILMIILYPLVLVSQLITKLLAHKEKQSTISRAELTALADVGHQEGVIEEGESRILKNIIRFRTIKASSIMTPRTVVMAVSNHDDLDKVIANHEFARFSRFPVYEGKVDHIIGFVHKHDVLYSLAKEPEKKTIADLEKREMAAIDEDTPINVIFEKMMENRQQIAMVLDEYGGLAGIVSMEDLMETLLGLEIVDEFDGKKDMQAYARQLWKERAKKLNLISGD